jgi:hypothetical protein
MVYGMLALAFLVLGGGLFAVRLKANGATSEVATGPRRARRTVLEEHIRQLSERMQFDRLAIGLDGRAAVGFLPRSRRLVFVDAAWVDGAAGKRGEMRAFDHGAEDVLCAEVVQQTWTRTTRTGEATPMVRSVTLKLMMRDLDAPVHILEFLGEDAVMGSDPHAEAVTAAFRWEALATALAAEARRDADVAPMLAGLSEEERKREQAKLLANKVLASRERRAQHDEAQPRQERTTP